MLEIRCLMSHYVKNLLSNQGLNQKHYLINLIIFMHKTIFPLIFHLILTPNLATIFIIFLAFDQLPLHSVSLVDLFWAL